jgi:hypothetical protein
LVPIGRRLDRTPRGVEDVEGIYFEGKEAPPADVEIREVVRGDDLS